VLMQVRSTGGGHGGCDPAEVHRSFPVLVPATGFPGQHRAVLATARRRWPVRTAERTHLEALHALVERRRPLDLYHSALEVRVPEGRFIIENCWPIPDQESAARGVVVEGPVGSRRMARWRVFRYEVRRWRDGTIADADEAVASPQSLSDDPLVARRLLNLVGSLPRPVWGRDELGTGEMWNSNSVISWLLARSGLPTDTITPPAGGRAPGWEAGLITAHRQHRSDEWLGMVRDPFSARMCVDDCGSG
jgi:hypothetical protein